MAKHKKKKFSPTSDPKKSEKDEIAPGKDNIPHTEKDNIPPTEKTDKPEIGGNRPDVEGIARKKKINKLFWIRIILAIIGGTAATFMFDSIEGEERRWSSIAFMILLFIVSIGIAKNMKLQLPSSDRKKLITTGIGSYVFIYLFSWIFSYSLVNIQETAGPLQSVFP